MTILHGIRLARVGPQVGTERSWYGIDHGLHALASHAHAFGRVASAPKLTKGSRRFQLIFERSQFGFEFFNFGFVCHRVLPHTTSFPGPGCRGRGVHAGLRLWLSLPVRSLTNRTDELFCPSLDALLLTFSSDFVPILGAPL